MAKIITLLIIIFKLILALEVVPFNNQLEYFNKKYLRFMKITILKRGRNSPHYINFELESYVGVGNNLTVKMALFEELSAGHYQPTPILGEYKLCDFVFKEPFFGQMYAKQLPANWTCPLPAGEYHFNNLVIHLENFPFRLPFTWSDVIVRTRFDVQGVLTSTNEEVFRWKTYVTVTQKLKKTSGYTKKMEKKTT